MAIQMMPLIVFIIIITACIVFAVVYRSWRFVTETLYETCCCCRNKDPILPLVLPVGQYEHDTGERHIIPVRFHQHHQEQHDRQTRPLGQQQQSTDGAMSLINDLVQSANNNNNNNAPRHDD